MYRSSWFLAAALVGTALVQPVAAAKSASEVKEIARSVTVEMKFERASGRIPGIIIGKQGNLYTLVANHYLLNNEDRGFYDVGELILHLPDGTKYQVPIDAIKLLNKSSSPVDLALVQFRSDHNYKVAKLAAPNSLNSKDKIYTAGFYSNRERFGSYPLPFNFAEGKAAVIVNKRLIDDNGYTFVYDTVTPEMYGGGVFDSNGQLIAIHGHDRYWQRDLAKRAIPVSWLLQNLAELRINLVAVRNFSSSSTPTQLPITAEDYFIAGFNESSTDKAIEKFSVAIQLNPKYQRAYFERARARSFSGMIGNEDTERARADFSQAILLDPKDYRSYYYRAGLIRLHSKEAAQKAIKEYDQVILLNPKFSLAYYHRAQLKSRSLDDFQGALADYNQIILLDPKDYRAYKDRADLKEKELKDLQGAVADYSQIIAILLNQKDYDAEENRKSLYGAYIKRADLLEQINNFSGALADYNQIILLYPKDYGPYYRRALLKEKKLKDRPGALADYDQAILLNPDETAAYNDRANLREQLGDLQGAAADRKKYAELRYRDDRFRRRSGSYDYDPASRRRGR
jgi:tetratricopeptide (TPR) repeat protein